MWYFLLYVALAVWVFINADDRENHALGWAIGTFLAGALYPNSTRQFGKGNLTSQRRVVGWKHIVGDRMVAASLPRSSSRSRSLGSYAMLCTPIRRGSLGRVI